MKSRKIKISLSDLANDLNGFDNKSIPIGVGYVASYCKKILYRNFLYLKNRLQLALVQNL